MHDPLTIGCLIDDFCKFQTSHIKVIENGDNRGSTIIEKSALGHTKQLAYQVNAKQFIDYMLACIFE
jgi:inosine-uridine nucleoside N-ribohydrolase